MGQPPRVRRRQRVEHTERLEHRVTSAGAEKTKSERASRFETKAHLRTSGEDVRDEEAEPADRRVTSAHAEKASSYHSPQYAELG